MESKVNFVHKDNHKTLNCEKCKGNYCTEKVDKKPCGYWCMLSDHRVEIKGLCEFCQDAAEI